MMWFVSSSLQVQYREYVQQLKKQHGTKVTVYKQVVRLLQEDVEKMREYWEGTASVSLISWDCLATRLSSLVLCSCVQSLANSNRNLLLENKGLYQQLKDGAEWMKREKVPAAIWFYLAIIVSLIFEFVSVSVQEKSVRELTERIEAERRKRETGWLY